MATTIAELFNPLLQFLTGNDNANRIIGTNAGENIDGLGGNDTIRARQGDDIVGGGEGDDRISGDAGDDTIAGGLGDDTVNGNSGDDVFLWSIGDGSDIVRGGSGYDEQLVHGSDAADHIELSGVSTTFTIEADGDSSTLRSVEKISVSAGDGADTVALSQRILERADLELSGDADEPGEGGFTLQNEVAAEGSTGAGGAPADLDAVLAEAEAGNIYFNTHSGAFPAGEVRGQLALLTDNRDENGEGTVQFGTLLDGGQEVQNPPVDTDSTGQGTVTFTTDGAGNVVSYTVSLTVNGVTLEDLTVLHLHNAPAGQNGPIVVDLLADAGADPSAAAFGDPDRFEGTAFVANDLGDTLDLNGADGGVFVDLDTENGGGGALSQNGSIRNIEVVGGGAEEFNAAANDFENVIGTEEADRLFGNAEINRLEGRGGDDVFHAFGGNDIYDGGAGTDTALFVQAVEGIVADLDIGIAVAGTDVNQLVSIENLTGGAFDDIIAGTDGSNTLIGNGGNDTIDGRGGDDLIVGGEGDNDLLTGGGGEDSFAFANGDGNGTPGSADQITDFSTEDDKFALDAESFGLAEDAIIDFANVARLNDGADPNGIDDSLDLTTFDASANVYVLQGAFANAGAARDAIANARIAEQGEATDEDEAGFFVYYNQAQGRNRLFAVEDLDDVGGSIQQVANLGDLQPIGPTGLNADSVARSAALDQLATFDEDNFDFGSDYLLV